MFKRWMALVLAAATVLSLAACSGNEDTETTTAKSDDAVATEVVTDAEGEAVTDEDGEAVTVTMEDKTEEIKETETAASEDKTTKADGKEDKTTKKSDSKTTTKKSESKTTTKKAETKTTTKATTTKKTLQVPSSVKDIVNAYKNAANKTKAQNDMKVDKTCDVDIIIDNFAGSDFWTKIAKGVASFFMNQAKGEVETEVFKNGKPTKNTKTKNGMYVTDKSTFIPIYGEEYMCTLDPANVESAVVTKKTNNTYDVKIILKDDKCSITGVPKITVSGMDYFNPNLYTEDLKGLSFSKGTVYYTDCVITATIDADGYLDYVKHDMKLKTDDTVVKAVGIDIAAALTGRYVTTFKFY